MDSAAITRDIEVLEREVSSLRGQVETDSHSLSDLERQVADLRGRLADWEESVREREKRLADMRAELSQAKRMERLDDYKEDLERYEEASGRVAKAAGALLEELEIYDNEKVALRELVDAMAAAFGGFDERVGEVETALTEEPEELRRSWEALITAVMLRSKERVQPERAKGPAVREIEAEDLSEDLQGFAEERRRKPILEYFSKS